MDATLVIRGRAAKNENLATRSLNRALSAVRRAAPTQDPMQLPGHNLKVRLAAFESFLITRCAQQFLSEEDREAAAQPGAQLDAIAQLIFYRWAWAHDVLHQVLADLDPFDVREDHAGSQEEAFKMATTLLETKYIRNEDSDKRIYRVQQLVSENSQFISELGNVDHKNINVVLSDKENAVLFRMVGLLFIRNWDEVSNWPGFSVVAEIISGANGANSERDDDDTGMNYVRTDEIAAAAESSPASPGDGEALEVDVESYSEDTSSQNETEQWSAENLDQRLTAFANHRVDELLKIENTWEAWRFVRMLRLLYDRPDNESHLRPLYDSADFREHWREVRIAADESGADDGEYRGFFPVEHYDGERLDQLMDFFEESSLTHTNSEYKKRTHDRALLDPSHYLEAIPWHELHDIESSLDVQSIAGIVGLDIQTEDNIIFKTWTATDLSVGSRVFYVNEDISSASLIEDLRLPGFLEARAVVLLCRKLHDSPICASLRHFWGVWNECAISIRPEDGQIFILESFIGAKFRQVYKNVGWNAAVNSYSKTMRRLRTGYSGEDTIREIMGPAYEPSFAHQLEYIPSTELSSMETYGLGQGSFGRVYRARWSKRPLLGVTDAHQKRHIGGDVALKVSLASRTAKGHNDFLRELRTLSEALADDRGGCIRFFGITQVSVDSELKISSWPGDGVDLVPALVFDFATEGTAISFLEEKICLGNFTGNWNHIFSSLSGLSWGLASIHQQGIVHCDIHPNNILVSREYFANSNSTDYHFLLSDLGEGKKITEAPLYAPFGASSDTMQQMVGVKHYRAPEVNGSDGFSKASDMYAFGQFGKDIIRRHSRFLQETGSHVLRLPGKLVHILESCTSTEPSDRYEAKLVGFMLDQVQDEFQSGKAELIDAQEIEGDGAGLLDWTAMSTSLNYSIQNFLE